MKATEFVYWIQGFFELTDSKTLNEKQVQTIKNHLKLVFLYDIDPTYSDDKRVQSIFQNIHDGKPPLEGVVNMEVSIPPPPKPPEDKMLWEGKNPPKPNNQNVRC